MLILVTAFLLILSLPVLATDVQKAKNIRGFAKEWQMSFLEPASPTMEKILDLHNDIMIFLIAIVIFVSYMLATIIIYFSQHNIKTKRFSFEHHTNVERIWTYVPTFILLMIATPFIFFIIFNWWIAWP